MESDENNEIDTEAYDKEYKKNQAISQSPHGIVISGEASESDEEIETGSKIVSEIPQSGSNFSISNDRESFYKHPADDFELNETPKSEDGLKYNSLLHKKLRERNQNLRRGLIDIACQPYQNASKEIHSISQQLIKSQILVQEVTSTLRRITNELFQLEDRLQAIKSGSFLPDIDISAIPPLDTP